MAMVDATVRMFPYSTMRFSMFLTPDGDEPAPPRAGRLTLCVRRASRRDPGVGWVEQRETHSPRATVGLAPLDPPYNGR